MLKELLLILTLFSVMQAVSMDHNPAVAPLIRNPATLREQCMNVIFAHKNEYEAADVAALPSAERNPLLGKMLIYLLGPVPAVEVAILQEPFLPRPMQCVTTDGKFVSAGFDGSLSIRNRRGKELATCRGHTQFISTILVTGKNQIISGSFDRTVRLWNAKGRALAVCIGHQDTVNCVCSYADLIISGSSDNTVRIWNNRGKQLAQCNGHTAPVMQVSVQADGRIVSASLDGTIRVWNVGLLDDIQKLDQGQSERIWALLQPYNARQDERDATAVWQEVRNCLYPQEQVQDENTLPDPRPLKRYKSDEIVDE